MFAAHEILFQMAEAIGKNFGLVVAEAADGEASAGDAELGAFAALPYRCCDAARHPAPRLIAGLWVGTGYKIRWGSPLLLASLTNRAIACLLMSDLPVPVVILTAL